MDKTTFSNPTIAKILNEEFYAVKFNAEQKDSIVYQGHTFKFIPSGRRGYHELAAALLNNKLSYPSIAFLFENNLPLTSVPGYKTANNLEPILLFLADDAFKTQSFEKFNENFKSTIK
jgi:thioredoxin-related protein